MIGGGLAATLGAPALALPPNPQSNATFTITRSAYCSLAINGSNVVQWAALSDYQSTNYPSDNPLNVTVQMVTSASGGSGSLAIQSPTSITGSQGNVLSPSVLTIFVGSQPNMSNAGAPYVTLVPGGTATIQTVAADLVVNATYNLFFDIDDTNLPIDTWTSSGFTLVATAT